ncbi:cytochrome P450 [Nocardia aurantia]|uniref:Cytochrome P450-SU2 n=1 Tax=Nocardia aurantia TaxID=2585199 RepID=A0A7K0DNJ1_9NOCA|nr:cytochrome P450 [Nocardia aurantia]MQY27310.1 Cytochrome P450-SU2 [Nocardia aurantia]
MSATGQKAPVGYNTARRPLPPEIVERSGCPFDPPAGRGELQREQGPVARVRLLNGAHIWLITGYDEVHQVLGDDRFSVDLVRRTSAMHLTPEQVAAGGRRAQLDLERTDGMFLFMDPPEHDRLRKVLTSQFTVKRMRALDARVREITTELLDAMQAAGTTADLVTDFALPLPSLVICELLGVPYADRAEFQERSAITLNTNSTPEQAMAAGLGLRQFMRDLVVAKRSHPGEDLLSGLISGELAADPPLTDTELVDIGTAILGAGHETTANMLALSVFALLENPDQLAALRADPSRIDATVEELLRYLSVPHTGPTRIASEDLILGGVTIPAGDTLVCSLPNANRDERRWPDPAQLDVTRPRSTAHLAFGYGIHQCLGQQLARVELRIGLTALFERLPDLRLAVPAAEIPLRTDMVIFGVHALPVAWG